MKAIDETDAADYHARLTVVVDGIAERRRQIAALQAEEAELLRDAQSLALERMDGPSFRPSSPRDIPLRSIAAEIGAATNQSDRAVQARMNDAAVLVEQFPATLTTLREGRFSRSHASVIVDAGLCIDDPDARAEYEAAVIPRAETETAGRLRPIARRLAEQFHPRTLAERHREARRQRRLWVHERDDGMAELGLLGPAHLVYGAYDRVTQLATSIVDAEQHPAGDDQLAGLETSPVDDTRGLDEVRADVALDLFLTGESTTAVAAGVAALRARVQVTIPMMSLLGHSEQPADLAGYGPIDAETARRIAADAPGWDRLLTHPISGTVLAVDRYRPTEAQRRMLKARDEHCRFPGCRQPTDRCDLDHTVAHAHDGPTAVWNLGHFCRRHHTLKHHSAWRVAQLADGTLEWTSPLDRVYLDHPARTLADNQAPF
ncbi:DUF222 domain-containing protein [Microbacterium sp.]|uniref:HNH endonuclease signature motif containing protein n=1 Tax=Microbacterium sp. TaxID=51671 RepID=UPI003C75E388